MAGVLREEFWRAREVNLLLWWQCPQLFFIDADQLCGRSDVWRRAGTDSWDCRRRCRGTSGHKTDGKRWWGARILALGPRRGD